MSGKFARPAVFGLGLLLACATLFAHHGTQVAYQVDKTITLKGTITEWAFAYPHPQIYFDVKDESGKVQHWAAELLPTPIMMRNMKVGWSKDTMKPGDEIVLTANPSKVAWLHGMPGEEADCERQGNAARQCRAGSRKQTITDLFYCAGPESNSS